MAGGGTHGSRELDQTPTWAVSFVCSVIVIISIILEKTLHKIRESLSRRRKFALVEALEKIKSELMILGFISLLLTFGQNYITRICIPVRIANTMLPCAHLKRHFHEKDKDHHHRRLLWYEHRILAADSPTRSCKRGHIPIISVNGLHQLHIFIFFLAIFHVFYSAITMMLGRMKIREWKVWEREIANNTNESIDSAQFRLTHEDSFVKGHTSPWTKHPVLFYIACFFRHMLWSVRRADYLTLRNGFISVHLAPGTKFNFQKYIKRSLEDDFKVIVGIPPLLWTAAVVYLLVNVNGSQAMFWLSVMPLVIILAVGTKLQSIITRMAIEIQERHAVVQGIPLVQVSDEHFWFNWPDYITLPLYALVTQMGSHMKAAIFDEQTSRALMKWHKKAKKKNEGSPQGRARKLGGSRENSPEKDSPASAETTEETPPATPKEDAS